MADALRTALTALNSLLQSAGVTSYKLGVESPAKLRLLQKNARFMQQEVYQCLVDNIASQGGLSSLPFCWFDGEKYHVLSGNHRVQAAMAAGLQLIMFLYTDAEMSREEQVAIQLAHNRITGQDDPVILKALWEEIANVHLKYLTGFDDAFFGKIKPVKFAPIKEPDLLVKQVTLFFIQEDIDQIETAAKIIQDAKGDAETWLARYEDFDVFFDAVVKIKAKAKIVNTATAIRKMAEMALEALAEPSSDAKGRVN